MKTRLLSLFITLAITGGLISGCAKTYRTGGGLRPAKKAMSTGDKKEAYNRYLAATIYEKQGDFDRAVKEMKHAAELSPESSTLTLRLIRAYLRQEDFDNALLMAEKAVMQLPDSANLRIVAGEIYHKLGRYDDAVDAFNKAISIDPGNVLGYGALVSIQEGANDLIAACDIYQRLAELSPKSAGIHFQLGLCYAKMNDNKLAQQELCKALELDPKLVRAHYVLAIIEMEAGNNQSAADHLAEYLAQVPDDIRACENMAGVLARLGNLDGALNHFSQVLSAPNIEPRVSVELMFLLMRAGRFDQLVSIPPPPDAALFASVFRTIAQKNQGADITALANSLDAIEGDLNQECNNYLNEVLYLFDKQEAGEFLINNLNAIREHGIKSKTIELVLTRTLISLDRHQEAEPILLDALERIGDDKELYYSLAIVNEKLNKIEQAEASLKAYLKLVPDDPEVLNFLGYLYAENNIKLDEAEALLNRALAFDPKNGFYLDSLGWVYYRRGDADKAIDYIKKAILAMDNDDAELRLHLGDAYLLKGDTEKALAEWSRAHRLNPTLEGVADKIRRYGKNK